jgi:hypothetical protein
MCEQVNAVKNEESSQISRLNDEIRMLKERLVGQQGGGSVSASVDTSALEEKHRQQLKEMEEALKLTWDDKARPSTQHEEDNTRLEMEQKKAARLLEVGCRSECFLLPYIIYNGSICTGRKRKELENA